MAYADWTFYSTSYLGNLIAEADFPRLALRASAVIDQITFNRAIAITDAATLAKLKSACCAIAEEIQKQDEEGGADGISSETVGAHSITYAENSNKQLSAMSKYIGAAKLYLSNTALLYAGFADTEYSGL